MKAKKNNKFYIIADLEGIAGISELNVNTRGKHINPVAFQRIARARKLLTDEVNSAINGIIEIYDNAEIVVNDSHGYGDSIYPERLNQKAMLIMGNKSKQALPLLDESYDGLLLIGAHSKAGSKGCMNHSFSRHVKKMMLNTVEVGEIGLYILTAAEFGVPTVFISGDNHTISEAQDFCSDISYVETKKTLSVNAAISLSPEIANKNIQLEVKKAVGNIETNKIIIEDNPILSNKKFELKVIYKKPMMSVLRVIKKRKFNEIKDCTPFSATYKGEKIKETLSKYIMC